MLFKIDVLDCLIVWPICRFLWPHLAGIITAIFVVFEKLSCGDPFKPKIDDRVHIRRNKKPCYATLESGSEHCQPQCLTFAVGTAASFEYGWYRS